MGNTRMAHAVTQKRGRHGTDANDMHLMPTHFGASDMNANTADAPNNSNSHIANINNGSMNDNNNNDNNNTPSLSMNQHQAIMDSGVAMKRTRIPVPLDASQPMTDEPLVMPDSEVGLGTTELGVPPGNSNEDYTSEGLDFTRIVQI